jgi:hypothetical protein
MIVRERNRRRGRRRRRIEKKAMMIRITPIKHKHK